MHPGVLNEAPQPALFLRDTYCPANSRYYCHLIRRSDHRNNPALEVLRLTRLEEIMIEKHSRSNHVVRLGSISFGRSKTVCTIRSISAFGAALDVAADEQVPDEFALTVIPDDGPRRCAVIWRKERRIAVAFY